MNIFNQNAILWYQSLKKPFFAPPSWLFSIVWGIIYPIIFITFGYVFYQVYKKRIPQKVIWPFLLNLLFNLIFSPIQFGLQNNFVAAIDISLVVITLIWAIKIIHPYHKKIAFFQIPYLAWGLFATILQFSVTILNL